MCNLSQGIRENDIAESEARLIFNMHKNGLTTEQIATYIGKSVDDVLADKYLSYPLSIRPSH